MNFKDCYEEVNKTKLSPILVQVSSMKFVNTLLDASSNTNVRVFLQHELEQAGLDVTFMAEVWVSKLRNTVSAIVVLH